MDNATSECLNSPIYERIGRGYSKSRKADPRWEDHIQDAVRGARTLVNIGAGSGSYEPHEMDVVAVEPSNVMIRQRPWGSAPVVCAVAEQLPFPDDMFDVALAVLTTHHWQDARAGLMEMRRVSRSQVVVTWDPSVFAEQFWLVRDYLPEIAVREQALPTLPAILEAWDDAKVSVLPVPADFSDGVLGAYWQRPEAYLSSSVRSAMSGIALTDQRIVEPAMQLLRSDLASGAWRSRYTELLELDELDLGYRLVCVS